MTVTKEKHVDGCFCNFETLKDYGFCAWHIQALSFVNTSL